MCISDTDIICKFYGMTHKELIIWTRDNFKGTAAECKAFWKAMADEIRTTELTIAR